MPLSKNTQQETDLFRAKQQIIAFATLLKYNNSQIESIQTLLSSTENINEVIKNTKELLTLHPEEQQRFLKDFQRFYQPGPKRRLTLQLFGESRTIQDLLIDAINRPGSATDLALQAMQEESHKQKPLQPWRTTASPQPVIEHASLRTLTIRTQQLALPQEYETLDRSYRGEHAQAPNEPRSISP